jgi:hypothetical protein
VNVLGALDARLLAAPRPVRVAAVALTLLVMLIVSLPRVPRVYLDYSRLPILNHLTQPEGYGTDSISDMYEAKVVLHDVGDMYTRTGVDQTPLEAATWTKEQIAPYPPAALLAAAGLYAAGDATRIGYYGMVSLLAVGFLALSLHYFLRTRWYLFPLLYLNFAYLADRFVHVQDGSYLVMLVVVLLALVLARHRSEARHLAMAVAITMKLSPLYYARQVTSMRPRTAVLFGAIVLAGLVLPYFLWDNYLSIYQFGLERKGDWVDSAGALIAAGLVGLLLWYVEVRAGFDAEDLVGWSLVPLAIFFALKLNAPRHLLLVLLVPDKRVVRNLAAAVGLGLPVLLPGLVRFGSVGPLVTVLLVGGLLWFLSRIGWAAVGRDLRHPMATLRLMLRPDPGRMLSNRGVF